MEPSTVEHRETRCSSDGRRARETRSAHASARTLREKKSRFTRHFEACRSETFQFKNIRIDFNEEEKFRRNIPEPGIPNEEESYTISFLTKKSACLR